MTIPREAALALIPKTPGEVAKSLLVIAVTLFAFIRGAAGDGFSPAEGLQFTIQAVTLVFVYLLTGTLAKTIAAFILAALQALAVPFSVLVGWDAWGSISFDDWSGAILAAFLAVGIAVVPNSPPLAEVSAEGVYDVSSLPKLEAATANLESAARHLANSSGTSRPRLDID